MTRDKNIPTIVDICGTIIHEGDHALCFNYVDHPAGVVGVMRYGNYFGDGIRAWFHISNLGDMCYAVGSSRPDGVKIFDPDWSKPAYAAFENLDHVNQLAGTE